MIPTTIVRHRLWVLTAYALVFLFMSVVFFPFVAEFNTSSWGKTKEERFALLTPLTIMTKLARRNLNIIFYYSLQHKLFSSLSKTFRFDTTKL